jgi:TRAP-type mannitol/chloroaromatic compound transport system permease small subunit
MKFLTWIDAISEKSGRVLSYFFIFLTFAVAIDVVMRYFFQSPTAWAFDTALHLYSIPFVIGGSWVLKNHMHIRVDVIIDRFPPKVRSVINLFFYLALLFPICIILIKHGIVYAHSSWITREVSRFTPLHPPIYPLKTIIPIAFSMLLLQGIAEFIRELKDLIKGESK